MTGRRGGIWLLSFIWAQNLARRYLDQNLKITIDEIRYYQELKRAGSLYIVSDIIKKSRH
jgi:hypothetical protein